MNITREFVPADRYFYDCGLCSSKNGFAQVDTKQDASYFGIWANPGKRIVFTYCEGDCITEICDTDQEFIDLLRQKAAWNDERGYGPMKIDCCSSGMSDLKASFERLGLKDLLH